MAAAIGLCAPFPASAQLGNRLRQMMAPPQQNVGGFQYAFYEGDLHFEHGIDPTCTALTNGTYKVYFAARTGPRGVEAYMFGEKILHAYISGSDRNHLSVTYLGDSAPSRSMHLTPWGSGFLGLVQSKTLVSEVYGACTTSNAEFKVSRTDGDGQSMYQQYEQQFQLDVASEQDLLLARHGHIREALPRLQQTFALKSKQYSANHPQMLRYYYYLASAYDEAGLVPFAAYWYQKSADVCVQAFGADNACAPITQLKLGVSLFYNGKTREAEASIRHALQVADTVFGVKAPVTWIGDNALAGVLIGTGRYAEAETTLELALALAKKSSPADLNVAAVKAMYAQLYRHTGQFKLAEDTLREAIALDQKVQGTDSTASIGPRVSLAQMLRLSGQSAAAEPIGKNALDAAVKLLGPERPDHPALSIARIGLGYIYIDLGRPRDAEDLIHQALDNDKKYLGTDNPEVAVDEMALAELLRTTGRERDALPVLQDAYRISHMTDLQGIRWRVPGALMQLYASGTVANPVLAIFYGKESVNGLQSLRGDLSRASSGSQQSFTNAKEVKSIYTTLAHLMLTDGRVSEAQQVLAFVSEQELDQFSQGSMLADVPNAASSEFAPPPAAVSPSTPASPTTATSPSPHTSPSAPAAKRGSTSVGSGAPAAAPASTEITFGKAEQELAELNTKQVEYGQQFDQLKQLQQEQGDDFSAADQAKLKELQHKMEDYQARFLAAQTRIAKTSGDPQARAARSKEISTYSTAFQGTLKRMGHDSVLAQYFITPDSVEIILTTPNAVIPASSPIKAAKLNQMIRDFRLTLSDTTHNPIPEAQQLYTVLIAPIAGALEKSGAKTMMLLLHDTLRYVPFAALYDGKNYLIDKMAVANVSEAALANLATQPNPEAWSVWGLGVTKAGKDYPALPNAAEELNDIKNELGGKSSVKLDQDFTETKLQAGLGGYYPVIHIASHFEFTPGSIDKSELLLGDGSRLSLKQIQLKLNFTGVELLTLSACETAVGDDTLNSDGSEVAGLGAIAQEKGAMAVIATLWPVADKSTATLMDALYKAHQTEHLDKAESLRHAQLALLHGTAQGAAGTDDSHRGLTRGDAGPDAAAAPAAPMTAAAVKDPHAPFAHPYYWAPFILMGNWL
jgi:CHAT domain-containing protein